MKAYSRDLKRKNLEKVEGYVSGEAKTDLCASIRANTFTTKYVADKCKVGVQTVRSWLRKYDNGLKMHDGPGQPQAIAPAHLEKIAKEAELAAFDFTTEELENKFIAARTATDSDYNKHMKHRFKICRKTSLKYLKKAGLKEGNAEIARDKKLAVPEEPHKAVEDPVETRIGLKRKAKEPAAIAKRLKLTI